MPATISKPDKQHDGLDDSGRRPPLPPPDKRTGGGGDGDNWDNNPARRRGPGDRLRSARIGLLCALGAVALFFIAIVSAFFVSKTSGHFDAYSRWINSWLPITLPSILWLNTAALAISSLTGEKARQTMFQEIEAMEEWIGLGRPLSRRATRWLIATLFFGALFLIGQTVAWLQLVGKGITIRHSPSTNYFYMLTGLHAIHLLVGVGALGTALYMLQRSRSMETRRIWVDCSVLYWHAMGILWLALLCVLEFGQ